MADSVDKDAEIQEILDDLDQILTDISDGDAQSAEALAQAAAPVVIPAPVALPARPAPVPVPVPAPAPAPKVAAPAPKPAAAVSAPAPKPVMPAPAVKPAAPPLPPPAAPAAAPRPAPAPIPAPVVLAAPAAAAPVPAAVVPPPAPLIPPPAAVVSAPAAAAAPAPAGDLQIELAPRGGSLPVKKPAAPVAAKPAPKKLASDSKPPLEISLGAAPVSQAAPTPQLVMPPAPKPAPVVSAPAAQAPAPVAAAAAVLPPAAAAASSSSELANPIPDKVPKEQIRRVAIVHTEEYAAQRDLFAGFMDQSALTVSKKPIYLRKVLCEVVGPQSDAVAFSARATALKVVAVLAIIEGLPEGKQRELSEACAAAGMTFRAVGPTEVQRRSLAVDIMVDLMLLPSEA